MIGRRAKNDLARLIDRAKDPETKEALRNIDIELDHIVLYLEKAITGDISVSPVVVSSSSGGGTSISSGEEEAGSRTVAAGSVTVNLISSFSSSAYTVVAYLMPDAGGMTFLGAPDSQTATSFTYDVIDEAGTLYFHAKTNA